MRCAVLALAVGLAGCNACGKKGPPTPPADAAARPVELDATTATIAAVEAVEDASVPERSVAGAFERVLPVASRPVGVFAAGTRALVRAGHTFVGHAGASKPYVEDATIGKGLPIPEQPFDGPDLVGGRWPELVAFHGHWGGSGGDPGYALYATHGKGWSRVNRTAYDRPRALVRSGAGFAIHEPESFHLENGMLPMPGGKPMYPCTDAPARTVASGVAGGASIRAPASFFTMAFASDGAGKPAGWGFVACKPGAFAFGVVANEVVPELLPGTGTCAERAEGDGLPLVTARIFPAASGGLYALTGPRGEATKGTCPKDWHRLERGPEGWRDLGALARVPSDPELLAIDPAGTAFAVVAPGTVLRTDLSGKTTELGLARSCSDAKVAEDDPPLDDPKITAIAAPFASDVWVTVDRGNERLGLCRYTLSP